jgi:hypothetical protein
MTRLTRRALGLLTVLGAVLLCGASAPHALPTSHPAAALFSPNPGVDRTVALPDGFAAAVDRATSAQFVSVVADDVDQDGDLDVVASVGSLDLLVWQNDGAGHFTRLPASQRRAFQTQPPPPAVDGDSIASNEWIQNDDRDAVGLPPLRAIVDATPRTPPIPAISLVRPQSGPRARSSRAPPLA